MLLIGSFAPQLLHPLLEEYEIQICKVLLCQKLPSNNAVMFQVWSPDPLRAAPLRQGEQHMEEQREQGTQLESPFCLSMGLFFRSCSSQAKANKENRSIKASPLPYKLPAWSAGARLSLSLAHSAYLAGFTRPWSDHKFSCYHCAALG